MNLLNQIVTKMLCYHGELAPINDESWLEESIDAGRGVGSSLLAGTFCFSNDCCKGF